MPPILGTLRLPFVILMPCCVAVGIATAITAAGHLSAWAVVAVLVGAVTAHVSVNAFNEYFDFRSGLDSITVRTPFSGGSGTLPAHPELAPATLFIAIASAVTSAAVGVYFVTIRGMSIAPLGIAGLLLVITYSTWWVRHPLACLVAPGLGIGVLTIVGTHFALTGDWSATAVAASLPVALLTSNLLLLNQFPDIDADRQVGRRNIVIVHGVAFAMVVFVTLYVAAYASVVVFCVARILPPGSLAALASAPLAIATVVRIFRSGGNVASLIPAMRLNVAVSVLTPLLLAGGIASSR